MAEISVARENGVHGIDTRNSVRRARTSKIPKSDRVFYDDSFVTVYDTSGRVVERGLWDDSLYRDDSPKWNASDGNYDLPHGYKLVIKNG